MRRGVVILLAGVALVGCGPSPNPLGRATTTPQATAVAGQTTTTESRPPTETPPPSSTTTAASTTTTSSPAPAFSEEAVDYFAEIALGAEFGGGAGAVVKWTQDIRIAVHGTPTATDLTTLDEVLADLDHLIDTLEISVADSGQNVDLYFLPESEFAAVEPNYVPGNVGFFWVWWDGARNITQSRVLISTDVTDLERSHLIREEMTQQLGLMNDSFTYPDSIFQQEWTSVQEYSAVDEQVIRILYLPQVTPGMSEAEVRAAVEGPVE